MGGRCAADRVERLLALHHLAYARDARAPSERARLVAVHAARDRAARPDLLRVPRRPVLHAVVRRRRRR